VSVTATDVLTEVAAALHLNGPSALQAFWTPLASWALSQAQTDRLTILAARGLTGDQIDSWIGADSFDKTQASFWALLKGGGLEESELEATMALDLREWLKTATLVDASGALSRASSVGKGAIVGGWDDVKSKEPTRRLGMLDPGTGRLMKW
jgi:hypothetical protein